MRFTPIYSFNYHYNSNECNDKSRGYSSNIRCIY
jgi:hypothetical protein